MLSEPSTHQRLRPVNVDDLLALLSAFGSSCTTVPAGPPPAPFDGIVAKLSFEEADAHLNAAKQHLYIDYGDDYDNRIDSTIAPHTLANMGQWNPVSYRACSRGTEEIGFKTIFDGQNRNTDTGGRWNIDSNLMWYWNHAYIRSGTCGNCESDPSVDTTASSTDVPLGSTLKWRESCDWDNNPGALPPRPRACRSPLTTAGRAQIRRTSGRIARRRLSAPRPAASR